MVDLARANARLREVFTLYASLVISGADDRSFERASHALDLRTRGLCVLADVMEIARA